MTGQLIHTAAALEGLCRQLRDSPWIALDTEFARAKTYYARLCLVQVAAPGVLACVDTLALADISPLLDLIYAPRTLKVFHSARQDLEVFYDLKGSPPAPVFDTQIAAALAGHGDQIGYAALVAAVTGVRLDKLHTRADWERRPLAPELIRYAEDDVRYLGELYLALDRKLAALERQAWLEEECAALAAPALYRNDPDDAWRRLPQAHYLPPAAQTVLKELAAWRERAAQQRNLPRAWVLPDAALLDIARATPDSLDGLSRITGVGGTIARTWGEDILAAVRRGLSAPARRWWDAPARLDREQQALYERMSARVRACAAERNISPTLLASRRDILALLRGDPAGALAHGWRRELVGAELLALRAAGAPNEIGP